MNLLEADCCTFKQMLPEAFLSHSNAEDNIYLAQFSPRAHTEDIKEFPFFLVLFIVLDCLLVFANALFSFVGRTGMAERWTRSRVSTRSTKHTLIRTRVSLRSCWKEIDRLKCSVTYCGDISSNWRRALWFHLNATCRLWCLYARKCRLSRFVNVFAAAGMVIFESATSRFYFLVSSRHFFRCKILNELWFQLLQSCWYSTLLNYEGV